MQATRETSDQSTFRSLTDGIYRLIKDARTHAARSINSILTATYWEIGRRIVEFDQSGEDRAGYGERLLLELSSELRRNVGRGFSVDNLESMRLFYQNYPLGRISETRSRISDENGQIGLKDSGSLDQEFSLSDISRTFPLSWSHYVRLIRRCKDYEARSFYEKESLRCGWSVRELDRQINSKYFERVLLSRNKSEMLISNERMSTGVTTPETEIKDPFILEFLDLKDEYSEIDLENALILHLENFLLEIGNDFCFMARQKKLRVGNEWFKVDLLFFHRVLRCLILIDLKVGKFSHRDVGQMHMYLNYARKHFKHDNENPPVGIILCSEKDHAVAQYSLEGLANKILAREYRLRLPDEKVLIEELNRSREKLEMRRVLEFDSQRKGL